MLGDSLFSVEYQTGLRLLTLVWPILSGLKMRPTSMDWRLTFMMPSKAAPNRGHLNFWQDCGQPPISIPSPPVSGERVEVAPAPKHCQKLKSAPFFCSHPTCCAALGWSVAARSAVAQPSSAAGFRTVPVRAWQTGDGTLRPARCASEKVQKVRIDTARESKYEIHGE
jgi:hypothetical protein